MTSQQRKELEGWKKCLKDMLETKWQDGKPIEWALDDEDIGMLATVIVQEIRQAEAAAVEAAFERAKVNFSERAYNWARVVTGRLPGTAPKSDAELLDQTLRELYPKNS